MTRIYIHASLELRPEYSSVQFNSNTLVNAWFQVASISIYFSFIRKVLPFEGVELVIVWFS